jgi:hypothetical protein
LGKIDTSAERRRRADSTLTELALQMGFRGTDTANQRRHYFEAGVGQGLAAASYFLMAKSASSKI